MQASFINLHMSIQCSSSATPVCKCLSGGVTVLSVCVPCHQFSLLTPRVLCGFLGKSSKVGPEIEVAKVLNLCFQYTILKNVHLVFLENIWTY